MVIKVPRASRLGVLGTNCLLLLIALSAVVVMVKVSAASLPADLNQDGAVNRADVDFFVAHWGTSGGTSDLNHDGRVNIFDLSLFLKVYGDAVAQNPSPPTVKDAKAFGIAAGSSLPELSPAELNVRLDGIAASGATWLRLDFSWPSIQPHNEQSYDWVVYDRIVDAANQRKLKILGILDYTPTWARVPECAWDLRCRPADPHKFANFAAATAARYAPKGVHTWEIWNEPNIGFWLPRADAAQYTALLKVTSQAIRQKDSDSHILTAGLSPAYTTSTTTNPMDFLRGIYENGGKGSFDAVAMHPYTFPYKPTSSLPNPWKEMYNSSPSLHSIMSSNGDGAKKIWITEFGSPTGGPGPIASESNPQYNLNPYVVDEGLQNAILADAIEQYKAADWAGPFFYYTYKDPGTSPVTNENFFGLVRFDGSQKPAYQTFKAAAEERF